jgi:hypothetical protein
VPAVPAPKFEIVGVDGIAYAAAPTMKFRLKVTDESQLEIFTIALTAQIMLEPAKRIYDAETRAALADLFGDPERWGATTQPFLWAHAETLVQSFTGEATFDLVVPCSYDLEVSAPRFLRALPDGEAPIAMHFTGRVVYRGEDGRVQLAHIDWDESAYYRLPVQVWDDLIERHYPGGGWIALHEETIDRLIRARSARGLMSFEATIAALVGESESAHAG